MRRDKNNVWKVTTIELITIIGHLMLIVILMPLFYLLEYTKLHLGRAMFFKLWGLE